MRKISNKNMANDKEKTRAREAMKQLSALKASNQMHAESIQAVLKNDKISEDEKEKIVGQINEAIRYNNEVAEKRYNATPEEVRAIQYAQPSKAAIEEYEERLKKRGLTAEQMESKTGGQYITATTTKSKGNTKNRKVKTRREKEREKEQAAEEAAMVIVPVENEEELMRQSLALGENRAAAADNARQNTPAAQNEKKKHEPVKEEAIKVAEPPRATIAPEKGSENEVTAKIKKMQKGYTMSFKPTPAGVSSDMIPLPSGGECYPHKISRVRVAALTANEENMLVSPNMYRDGHLIDMILREKIKTEEIKVEELCKGDRDAIVLWLRATAYGPEFPVYVIHPNTGKRYDVIARLDEFPYKEFDLKGDENGHFTYVTTGGDVLKFRCLTYNDDEILKKKLASSAYSIERQEILRHIRGIRKTITESDTFPKDTVDEVNDYLDDMNAMMDELDKELPTSDQLYTKSITEKMSLFTVSVNGNDDRDFVNAYIENMMAGEARKYRTYVSEHVPGIDFTMTIPVPESDGGGSFETFLGIDDTVFINV